MLRLVHRIFWLRQVRMGIDPIDSISLGSKFPEIVHGPEHLKIVLSVIDDWARSQLNHD
jgi:hypothetical protein